MIKSAFKDASQAFQEEYESLILQGKLDTWVQMETSFFEASSTESLWGLLVNAGYLTIARVLDPTNGYYTIRIPNQEVQKEFRSLTAYHNAFRGCGFVPIILGLVLRKKRPVYCTV